MKERPILFSAPMVRAILDGKKTQTRRVLKPQPQHHYWERIPGYQLKMAGPVLMTSGRMGVRFSHVIPQNREWDHERYVMCPYGQPSDRLWVREAWGYRCSASTPEADRYMHTIAYRADDARRTYGPMPLQGVGLPKWRERDDGMSAEAWDERMTAYWRQWRPSIFMPRWASRITLEVTGVRVERLQDISEADAQAEGCERLYDEDPGFIYRDGDNPDWKVCPKCGGTRLHNALGQNLGVIFDVDCRECDTYVKRYRHLWEAINGPGSWDANPWVWVVEFRKLG